MEATASVVNSLDCQLNWIKFEVKLNEDIVGPIVAKSNASVDSFQIKSQPTFEWLNVWSNRWSNYIKLYVIRIYLINCWPNMSFRLRMLSILDVVLRVPPIFIMDSILLHCLGQIQPIFNNNKNNNNNNNYISIDKFNQNVYLNAFDHQNASEDFKLSMSSISGSPLPLEEDEDILPLSLSTSSLVWLVIYFHGIPRIKWKIQFQPHFYPNDSIFNRFHALPSLDAPFADSVCLVVLDGSDSVVVCVQWRVQQICLQYKALDLSLWTDIIQFQRDLQIYC